MYLYMERNFLKNYCSNLKKNAVWRVLFWDNNDTEGPIPSEIGLCTSLHSVKIVRSEYDSIRGLRYRTLFNVGQTIMLKWLYYSCEWSSNWRSNSAGALRTQRNFGGLHYQRKANFGSAVSKDNVGVLHVKMIMTSWYCGCWYWCTCTRPVTNWTGTVDEFAPFTTIWQQTHWYIVDCCSWANAITLCVF